MSVVGLDVGTSRIKAVRFDDAWQAADSASTPSIVERGQHGEREQDMHLVRDHAFQVLAEVVRRSPDRVRLVAVTGQGDGCWLVDNNNRPVGPALLWNDSRAAPIVERWQREGRLADAFRRNGCQGAPGLAHAQLAWLRRHDPDLLAHAASLLSCTGWIHTALTGRRVVEPTDAANPFFDARTRRYDTALLDLFGLQDLARLLPDIVTGTQRLATPIRDVADELGLEPDTLIGLAPYDVPATAIGTGVIDDDTAFAILGTTLCAGLVSSDPHLDRPANGMTLPGTSNRTWLLAYATMIGTEVLDWTANLLGLHDAAAVTALAGTSTRADLPLVLPYLSPAGERSPFLDPSIRGTITGLDNSHTPADIARATIDALSLVVRDCLTAAPAKAHHLALSGGGAASDLWCQTISDAIGLPVLRPDTAEVGARGAVLSAATDAGFFPDLHTAINAAVRPGLTCHPNSLATQRYDDRYQQFLLARTRFAGTVLTGS